MKKLTKKEMTQELRPRQSLHVYDVVVNYYYTGNAPHETVHIAANNEIEAARIVREQYSSVRNIFSITWRTDLRVWA